MYDCIVIGAGHNGLVCSNYLAQKGWKVLVIEKRHVVGGACVTEEIAPGYKASIASYVVSLLLPEIVDDHRHLLGDKDLSIGIQAAPVDIVAPMAVVQAAIGNLLRNAIENSGRGHIELQLSASAVLTLQDPGHGMSPEEIAAIHARMARGGRADRGSGIGLDLIARLCEHLGWTLQLQPCEPRGTRVTLDFSASRPA